MSLATTTDCAPKACSIDDCDRDHYARGWCNMHWRRWRRHGDPAITKSGGRPRGLPNKASHPPADCAVKRCRRASLARGWCNMHYLRWRRTGSVTLRPKLDAAGRARMQNVEFLLDPYRGAESPQMICVRLNTNAHALARWLERHGERELAHTFYGLDKQDTRSRQGLAA